jgi:hypothetical protein
LGNILTTGFGETAFSVQVVSNVLAGLVCAALAWWSFGIATRNPVSEPDSRGLVSRSSISLFSTGSRGKSWFGPRSCQFWNPFVWKDFYFVAGGSGMLLVRCAYYFSLGIMGLTLEGQNDPTATGWFAFLMFLMWVSVPINAARLLSRSLQDEVRGQTLSSLLILPRSLNSIVYAKLGGALMGWLPALLICIAITLLSPSMRSGLFDVTSNPNGWGLGLFVMLTLYFALIPHFAMLLALYVRWGAVAIAVGMTIGVYFLTTMGLTLAFLALGMFAVTSRGNESIELLLVGISFFFFCICAGCHIAMLLRIQALAAK